MSDDETPREPPDPVGTNRDIEAGLRRMQDIKREQDSLKAEYEELRDWLAGLQFGSAYFVGPDHRKHYGYVVNPEKVVVDPSILDELDQLLVDEVAPRKIDTGALKQAVATGRISEETVARFMRVEWGTSHIRFGVMED